VTRYVSLADKDSRVDLAASAHDGSHDRARHRATRRV